MNVSNRLAGLKARRKSTPSEDLDRIDAIGEAHGFTDRGPRRKPGRKPSPRTYQLHPKIFPAIGAAIVAEAERLGLTQGQMIERMWEAYRQEQEGEADTTGE